MGRKPQWKVLCWFYRVQPVHAVSLFPCFCITIMHCNLVFAFSFPWWCLLSGSCSMFRGQAGLFNSAAASHEYTLETVSAAGLISGRGGGARVLACISPALSFLSLSLSHTCTHVHAHSRSQGVPMGRNSALYQVPLPSEPTYASLWCAYSFLC